MQAGCLESIAFAAARSEGAHHGGCGSGLATYSELSTGAAHNTRLQLVALTEAISALRIPLQQQWRSLLCAAVHAAIGRIRVIGRLHQEGEMQ